MLKKEGFRPFLLILIIIEFTLPTLQTDRRNEFRKPFLCVYALEKYEIKSWTRGRDKFLEFLIGFYTVIFSRKVSFVIFVKVVQYVLGEYVEPFKKGNIEEGKNEKFLCPAAPQLLLAKFPFKKSFWIFQTTFHFPTTAAATLFFGKKAWMRGIHNYHSSKWRTLLKRLQIRRFRPPIRHTYKPNEFGIWIIGEEKNVIAVTHREMWFGIEQITLCNKSSVQPKLSWPKNVADY